MSGNWKRETRETLTKRTTGRQVFIRIDVECDQKNVFCSVVNSRNPAKTPNKAGIGLDNVTKRLDLIYGKEYSLKIDDSKPEQYSIKLTIPITK